MTQLVSQASFHQLARAGRGRGNAVAAQRGTVLRAASNGSRVVRFVFSDGSCDRCGDRIDPNGWKLEAFKRNPVILWAHDADVPPIGRAPSVWSDGTRLLGDVEFVDPAILPFAGTVLELIRAGYLRGISVGFIPITWEWSDEKGREGGINFRQQSLIEASVVCVPANAHSLAEARAKGIDTQPLAAWAARALGNGGSVVIPRAELQVIQKAASSSTGRSRSIGWPGRTEWLRRCHEAIARSARIELVKSMKAKAVSALAAADPSAIADRVRQVREHRTEAAIQAAIDRSDQTTIRGRRAIAAALRRFRL